MPQNHVYLPPVVAPTTVARHGSQPLVRATEPLLDVARARNRGLGAPTLPPTPVRRLGRRLLGSELLEALAAPHGVDRYLELVRPSWSLREARAELIEIHRQTADSVTLTLRPNENWRGFSTGQFVRLTIEIDGVRQTRCYSPACSEHAPGRIEITAKAHPEGLVSGYLNRGAQAGMVVGLSAADGDFVLSADRPERLLLISGGTGITPVISMLRTLCD